MVHRGRAWAGARAGESACACACVRSVRRTCGRGRMPECVCGGGRAAARACGHRLLQVPLRRAPLLPPPAPTPSPVAVLADGDPQVGAKVGDEPHRAAAAATLQGAAGVCVWEGWAGGPASGLGAGQSVQPRPRRRSEGAKPCPRAPCMHHPLQNPCYRHSRRGAPAERPSGSLTRPPCTSLSHPTPPHHPPHTNPPGRSRPPGMPAPRGRTPA